MHRFCITPIAVAISAVAAMASAVHAQPESRFYTDVTASHLPGEALKGLSMDAKPGDLDGDGDLDIVVANEHRPNIVLINDGRGHFADESAERIPQEDHDSEDIGIADLDGDGDADVISVSEDDRTNELYLNDGDGRFSDAKERLPVRGTSNAVLVRDLTGDGHPDILIGNNGQNRFLVNDGGGHFSDATGERLPARQDVTQDLELGDVDGDGDLDLIAGNEDDNRLMLNDGAGHFTDAPDGAIPLREAPEETREADFGDIDGDGDPDLLFANIRGFVEGADPQNRVLVNDGSGQFTDATDKRLPTGDDRSFDGDFIDVDRDGDLDIVTSNANVDMEKRRILAAPYRVYRNDGTGVFAEATDSVFPETVTGRGFDVEPADFNGDGILDLYFASRRGTDRLLLGHAP